MARTQTARQAGWQGMNWCAPATRLAIYLRDGLACVYCGSGIEDGTKLTLDHITPHSQGGTNASENMVCCCHKCNSSRGDRDYKEFAEKVASYLNHGITGQEIIDHIETTRKQGLDRKAAKDILARRPGFAAALQSLKST